MDENWVFARQNSKYSAIRIERAREGTIDVDGAVTGVQRSRPTSNEIREAFLRRRRANSPNANEYTDLRYHGGLEWTEPST